MRISHGRLAGSKSEQRSDTFTGRVWADPVLGSEDGIAVTTVLFEPGSRTYWHRHEVAQVLLITHGEGRLQLADGTGGSLRLGDVAHISAGEVHWHGATATTLLLHVAVSVGKTDWLAPVSEEDYINAMADERRDVCVRPAGASPMTGSDLAPLHKAWRPHDVSD